MEYESEFDKMKAFVKSAWPARRFIVPCLQGPAGIGKTAAIKEVAAELAEENDATGKVVTIIASQILPNEVSGITMPVAETKAMEIFDHFRLGNMKDGDILFFDELLEADQLVLSACLTLIESRELMSGRKLPDIMIVAATNPTIQPTMLKENIRQRFVWQSFKIDKDGCRKYLKDKYKFDVGEEVISKLVATNSEYNILSPRSLTKMVEWIVSARTDEEREAISTQICRVWGSSLGSKLKEQYDNARLDPERQAKRAIVDAMDKCGYTYFKGKELNDSTFEDATMEELVEILEALPDWGQVKSILENTEMQESKENNVGF